MARPKKNTKGIFGATRLPVAGRYLVPRSRRPEWLVGLALVGVALFVLAVGFATRGARVVTRAPVSSAHATFEATCSACHQPFGGVADSRCLDCHERRGETGFFTLAAHAERFLGTAADLAHAEPVACATCHPEHNGRRASITDVADKVCADCHGFGSLAEHPELRFARENLPDDANLTFSHRLHVARLSAQKAYPDPQQSCLYCHQPEADGAGFEPLDFTRQCGECHLAAGTATAWMPIGDPAAVEPGVMSLEAIRDAEHPGTRWAWFQNPDELRRRGSRIAKQPVYHEDPWILENLRRIREVLYPDAGLAALLPTAVIADPGGVAGPDAAGPGSLAAPLTRDVLGALREQVRDLRRRPETEIQVDLDRIEALLEIAERRQAAGETASLDALVLPAEPDPSLGQERIAAILALARDLTGPCRQCHVVSSGAILHARREQRTLHRARFDHRAHVLLVPHCVDCHSAIPSILAGEGTVDEPVPLDPADLAATQNLPTIAVCRDCHAPERVASNCTTCHDFHPGEGRHLSDLRIWVADAEATP